MEAMFRSLWEYRGFILASVRREFEARYKVSLFGGLWVVLNPLAQIIVYTVILSNVMRAKLPGVDAAFGYSIYLCSGVITWGLFTEIVSRSLNVFIENANLMKKLSFPRICLLAIVVGSACVNFIIIILLFFVFLLVSGNLPGWEILAMLPVLTIQTALAVGLGILLGVANVFFRDVGQGTAILLQFWFWLTPIVYPVSVLPDRIRPWLAINPMTAIVTAYQDIFVAHHWPVWGQLLVPAVFTLVVVMVGIRFFRQHAGEMVDEL